MKKIKSHHGHGKRPLKLILTLMLGLSLAGATLSGCSDTDSSPKTTTHHVKKTTKASSSEAEASSSESSASAASSSAPAPATTTNPELANLAYNGTQTIDVNGGKPTFDAATLSTSHGTWQTYADLDGLNRAVDAEALMNKAMMPTAEREPLTWDPTGWHNKRIASGYLYNRSHLIGYQLTGQNNNPKNLITGTRSLNSPEMLRYEDDIAYFMKTNPQAYVRYSVVPVFKGDNLLASGVHMMAQSVGANGISFNVYIFNIEEGVTLNYADGTSVVNSTQASTQNAAPAPAAKASTPAATTTQRVDMNTNDSGKIIGNRNSHIYHVPGQAGYRMNSSNAVYFQTEQQAQAAGYRKAKR